MAMMKADAAVNERRLPLAHDNQSMKSVIARLRAAVRRAPSIARP